MTRKSTSPIPVRNLDHAFPPFALGLPSVYERAGFEVNRSRSGSRSSSRAGSITGSMPGSMTMSGSMTNIGSASSSSIKSLSKGAKKPQKSSSLRKASNSNLVHSKESSTQEIPERDPSRANKDAGLGSSGNPKEQKCKEDISGSDFAGFDGQQRFDNYNDAGSLMSPPRESQGWYSYSGHRTQSSDTIGSIKTINNSFDHPQIPTPLAEKSTYLIETRNKDASFDLDDSDYALPEHHTGKSVIKPTLEIQPDEASHDATASLDPSENLPSQNRESVASDASAELSAVPPLKTRSILPPLHCEPDERKSDSIDFDQHDSNPETTPVTGTASGSHFTPEQMMGIYEKPETLSPLFDQPPAHHQDKMPFVHSTETLPPKLETYSNASQESLHFVDAEAYIEPTDNIHPGTSGAPPSASLDLSTQEAIKYDFFGQGNSATNLSLSQSSSQSVISLPFVQKSRSHYSAAEEHSHTVGLGSSVHSQQHLVNNDNDHHDRESSNHDNHEWKSRDATEQVTVERVVTDHATTEQDAHEETYEFGNRGKSFPPEASVHVGHLPESTATVHGTYDHQNGPKKSNIPLQPVNASVPYGAIPSYAPPRGPESSHVSPLSQRPVPPQILTHSLPTVPSQYSGASPISPQRSHFASPTMVAPGASPQGPTARTMRPPMFDHGIPPRSRFPTGGGVPRGAPPHGGMPLGSMVPQVMPPHRMPPHGMAPHGFPSHGMAPHGMTPNGMHPQGMVPQRMGPQGMPPQSQRTPNMSAGANPDVFMPPKTRYPKQSGASPNIGTGTFAAASPPSSYSNAGAPAMPRPKGRTTAAQFEDPVAMMTPGSNQPPMQPRYPGVPPQGRGMPYNGVPPVGNSGPYNMPPRNALYQMGPGGMGLGVMSAGPQSPTGMGVPAIGQPQWTQGPPMPNSVSPAMSPYMQDTPDRLAPPNPLDSRFLSVHQRRNSASSSIYSARVSKLPTGNDAQEEAVDYAPLEDKELGNTNSNTILSAVHSSEPSQGSSVTFDFNQPPLEMSLPERNSQWYTAEEQKHHSESPGQPPQTPLPKLSPLHIRENASEQDAGADDATPVVSQEEFKALQSPPTKSKVPEIETETGKRSKVCRGCSKAIVGKSMRAKDGTLSGRWHKECLNCRDCSKSLAGVDKIHVLENQPFCARCYHVANNTTCAMCKEGIEGPCLETRLSSDDGQPFLYHVNCLQCASCSIKLQHSYFDVAGVPYCAEHAFSSLPDDQSVHKRYTQYMMI